MANILGIIAEYNPLHNGHIYHIKKSKEASKADLVVAIMTGNFTQRGNTSVINKWEKAKIAIENGIDLVIELPTLYSTSSAENFANGAIKIFKELNLITHISCGIENANLKDLNNIADVLFKEPREYNIILKEELTNGVSYPKARENAIVKYFNNKNYENILSGSNNILAIEYLKAMKQYRLKADFIGIKRKKTMYNSKETADTFASATAIRHLLLSNNLGKVASVVPNNTFNILTENIKNGTYVFDLTEFEKIIIYNLRMMSTADIANLPDVSEGLENVIKTAVCKTNNLLELIEMIKSKRYTQTRIQRILIYALLGITKKDMEMSKSIEPYIRVLGVSSNGKKLLSKIENKNVITSVKSFENLNRSRNYTRMLNIDKKATDIYTIIYSKNAMANLDYTTKMLQILQ